MESTENTSGTDKIDIDQDSLRSINTLRKWTMFHAVLGFIFLGLFVITGAIAGTFLTAFSTGKSGPGLNELSVMAIIFILAVAYFFPVLFLFRFSKYSAHVVHTQNKKDLSKALKNLKAYFVYLGVILIICLVLYFVVLYLSGSSMTLIKGLE
jgi:hypothetical protein